MGLGGKIESALRSLYDDVKCCVKVNGHCTDFVDVLCGVKQGCLLSPILFIMYINDCINMINSLGKGIILDNNERVSRLLYADDIVLVSENEIDLQIMLDNLHVWCEQWGLVVNGDKSKVVHFRNPSVQGTHFKFNCGDLPIDGTDRYKHLSLWLTEHLDMNIMANEVAKSAHREGQIQWWDPFPSVYQTI